MTIRTDEEQEQEQTSNIKNQLTSIIINAGRFGTSQIIHIPYIMPIWRTQHRPRTRQKCHHSNSPTAPPRPISGDKGHPLPLWRFFSVAIGSSKQSVYKQFVFPEIVFHKTVPFGSVLQGVSGVLQYWFEKCPWLYQEIYFYSVRPTNSARTCPRSEPQRHVQTVPCGGNQPFDNSNLLGISNKTCPARTFENMAMSQNPGTRMVPKKGA